MKRGFSTVETLVVIFIAAMIISLVIASTSAFRSSLDNSKVVQQEKIREHWAKLDVFGPESASRFMIQRGADPGSLPDWLSNDAATIMEFE